MWLRQITRAGGADLRAWTRVEVHRSDAVELPGQDVEAAQLRPANEIGVELRRLRAAEVPTFAGRKMIRAAGVEQRPEVCHGVGDLVVLDEDRSGASTVGVRTEEHV